MLPLATLYTTSIDPSQKRKRSIPNKDLPKSNYNGLSLPKAIIVVLPLQILITKHSLDEKLNETFREYIRM